MKVEVVRRTALTALYGIMLVCIWAVFNFYRVRRQAIHLTRSVDCRRDNDWLLQNACTGDLLLGTNSPRSWPALLTGEVISHITIIIRLPRTASYSPVVLLQCSRSAASRDIYFETLQAFLDTHPCLLLLLKNTGTSISTERLIRSARKAQVRMYETQVLNRYVNSIIRTAPIPIVPYVPELLGSRSRFCSQLIAEVLVDCGALTKNFLTQFRSCRRDSSASMLHPKEFILNGTASRLRYPFTNCIVEGYSWGSPIAFLPST
jgi:hypothetical protein